MAGRLRGADIRERNRYGAEDAYFEWLMEMVLGEGAFRRRHYGRLFRLLHETVFVWLLSMDENRAEDGMELRRQFALETGLSSRDLQDILDRPCSVLEMMVALARRCEEHITDDPGMGDRTGQWFFGMLESLGLERMDDAHFDKIGASEILERFMNREHDEDGHGALFTASRGDRDMRKVEIWYQMMQYLSENVYA